MFKIPLPELKEKLTASKKISAIELDQRIKEKINELSGLISEEGAAHIIANELGVQLVDQQKNRLKIKEIYAGMMNVSALGKVVKKFEVREFSKGDKKGKVCSLMIGDETGTMRLVLWNDQVDSVKTVQEDDVVLIKDAYVRENNNARELHLGDRGELTVNPKGEVVASVRKSSSFERKPIQSLQGGEEGVEILGTVVQVFDPRFFQVCPQCAKKVTQGEGSYSCAEHGVVQPAVSYVLNAVFDDGTGTIRGVFWKNQTTHLLGKDEQAMALYRENAAAFEDVKTDLLGEQFKLMGRVKNNEMFNRLELNVQLVEKANAAEELARLEKQ